MKKSITVLLFIVLFPTIILPDSLQLANGDTITGKIIKMDEEKVQIKTEYGVIDLLRTYIKEGIFKENNNSTFNHENEKNSSGVQENKITIPRQNLICEYLFNGSLDDSSGNSFILKNINGIQFCDDPSGNKNSSICSDGTGKYLELPQNEELNDLNAFTISFWLYSKDNTKSQYIIAKWNTTKENKANGKFAINCKADTVSCYVVDEQGNYYLAFVPNSLETNTWSHIVATCSIGKVCIYVNNKKFGEKQFPFTNLKKDNSPLYILTAKANNETPWAYYNFIGMVDNIRIFSRKINETEIEALFKEHGS